MTGAGYVRTDRRLFEHEMFEGDEYSRREAWMWLIANAAWQDGPKLKRGEVEVSQPEMVRQFGWSRDKVRWFLRDLYNRKMVKIHTHTHTQGHTHTPAVITICNYNKYQDGGKPHTQGHTQGHTQVVKEESKERISKEDKKEEKGPAAPFAFQGDVIKLNQKHFDAWAKAFANLNLLAELTARDAWLATPQGASARTNWFVSTSTHFRNLNQRASQQAKQQDKPYGQTPRPNGITSVINRMLADLDGPGSAERPRNPVLQDPARLLPDRRRQ